jgi:hypothetical protein
MIRFFAVTLAGLVILCGAPAAQAQSAADIAQREAQARTELAPQFAEGMRQAMKATRDRLPIEGLAPEEASAMLNAYDQEADALVSTYTGRFVSILARHIPLDQLYAAAPTSTPEWTAAMTEVMTMIRQEVAREGPASAARVMKIGCSVRARPTEACVALLERVEQLAAAG